MRPIIHQVSCSAISEPAGPDFERVRAKAEKVRTYARKLGFDVLYESVDEVEPGDAA